MSSRLDAVVILGGGLKKDKTGWRTTNFNEGDNFGALGDRLRVEAGYLSYVDNCKFNADLLILTSGGKGQLKNIAGAPTIASVLKKELLGLGVPPGAIITEEKSGNSYQQLKELAAIISSSGWNQVAIISNRYHLPRVRAMIESFRDLDLLKTLLFDGNLKLLSAEEVLIDKEPKKWRDSIAATYQSQSMKERIALEQKGVEQIKAGSYKFN